MIKPVGKNLLIQPYKEPVKSSLLLTNDPPAKFYMVISVGDEVTKASKGDKLVILHYNNNQSVEFEKEIYYIINEDKILAKIV